MIFFARQFKQDVRELSKKYRHIREIRKIIADYQP